MEIIRCEECGIEYYSETIVKGKSFRHVYPDIVRLETELTNKDKLLMKTNHVHIENQRLQKDLNGELETNQRLTDELIEARAEIEQLKLTTGELTGAFNARPKCAQCKRKEELIEQMREALNVLVASATPSGPLWHGSAEMQIARAALSAAERSEGL